MNKSILYYTYTYTYPEEYPDQQLAGTVFYVGKGQGSRIKEHLWEARRGVQSFKCDIIREIWEYGLQPVLKKVLVTEVEQDVSVYEWALINILYEKKKLANICYGGSGRYAHYQGSTELMKVALPSPLIMAFEKAIPDSFSDYLINLICFDLNTPPSQLRYLSRQQAGDGYIITSAHMPCSVTRKLSEAITRFHAAHWIIEHLMCSDPMIIEAMGNKASWITTKPYLL